MHKDVGKRVMALLLSICMIAGMVDWSGFTVRAAEGKKFKIIEVKVNGTYSYDGTKHEPTLNNIEIHYEDEDVREQIVEESDMDEFDISYGENIEAGNSKGKVIVTAKEEGKFEGTVEGYFNIGKRDISSVTIDKIEDKWSLPDINVSVENEVVVKDTAISSEPLKKDKDYQLEIESAKVEQGQGQATITVKVQGINNYTGVKETTFVIHELERKKLEIEFIKKSGNNGSNLGYSSEEGYTKVYTQGKVELLPDIEVKVKYDNEYINKENYTLDYSPKRDGIYIGDLTVNATITGGKYAGLKSDLDNVVFTSVRSLSSHPLVCNGTVKANLGAGGTTAEIDWKDFEDKVKDPAASAEVQNMSIQDKFNVKIDPGWEEKLQASGGGDIDCTATVSNKCKYYRGTMKIDVILSVPKLSDSMIHIMEEGVENTKREFTFDGSTDWIQEITTNPQKWIRVGEAENPYEYGVDKDYTISKVSTGQGINQGSYKFKVSPTGKGKLRGEPVEVTIKVLPMDISSASGIDLQVQNVEFAPGSPSPKTPKPVFSIYYTNGLGSKVEMKANVDYVNPPTYEGGVNAGDAKIKISGKGNFTGIKEGEYRVTEKNIFASNNVSISQVPSELPYNWGEPVSPSIEVRVDNYLLTEGKDYEILYQNAAGNLTNHATVFDGDDGVIKMIVKGIGNYIGEATGSYIREFKIVPFELKEADINVEFSEKNGYTYTGDPIDAEIQIFLKKGGKLVPAEAGYDTECTDNVNVTKHAKIKITGRDNLSTQGSADGALVYEFEIKPCDLSTLPTLQVTAESADGVADGYDLVAGDANGEWKNNYYLYTGAPIDLVKDHKLSVKNNGKLISVADYTVSYGNHTNIGEAVIKISGSKDNENYEGERALRFAIKGDLRDFNTGGANKRTEIKIPDQIYNNDVITPEMAEDSVTFRIGDGADEEIKKLVLGEDYTVENSKPTETTPVGMNMGNATITGQGWYVNQATANFTVKPLNLTQPGNDLSEKYHYKVEMGDKYTYSGFPIRPKPEITHGSNENNNPLVEGTAYELEYYDCNDEDAPDGQLIPDSADGTKFGVGSYKVKVKGKTPNYEGETEKGYEIEPYNLEEGKAKGYITIEGDAEQVVLDHIKYPEEYSDDVLNGDPDQKENDDKAKLDDDKESIIWKDLKVWYTPVDLEGNTVDLDGDGKPDKKELELGTEYTLTYVEGVDEADGETYSNRKPGKAKYVIEGIGNFAGKLEKTYTILADLGSVRTKITMGDEGWIYTPDDENGVPTNCPIPESVEYEVTIDEEKEIVPIAPDGYAVTYENNSKATSAPKGKEDEETAANLKPEPGKEPTAIVTATEGGITYGSSKAGTFEIYQRDITETVPKADPLPVLYYDGIDENGYEYTGEPIRPDIQLYCKETALKKKGSDGVTDANYEYEVEEKNNINVYDENGEKSDTHAILTAKKNSEGKYDGNYYGNYRVDFKINPRKISDETIDTPQNRIKNSRIVAYGTPATPEKTWIGTYSKEGEDKNEWECSFTEKPICFPKEGKELEPPYLLSDGLTISWYGGEDVVDLTEGKDYTIEYKDNIAVGEATVLIKAKEKSNYEGEFPKHFKIMLSIDEAISDKQDRYIELTDYDPNVPFTAQYAVDDVFPKLEFVDKTPFITGVGAAKALVEGEDFVIATKDNYQSLGVEKPSSNNQEVREAGSENPPTFVVVGIGNYNGSFSLPYNIIPKDISDPANGVTVVFQGNVLNDEQYTNAYIYDGKPKGEVWIYNNDPNRIGKDGYTLNEARRILRNERDYKLEWANNVEITTDTSKATVTITAMGTNYTGKRVVEFSIVPQPIKEATATIAPQTFNRQAKTPEVTLNFGGKTLVEGTDYSIVEYKNNTNASVNAQTDEEKPAVVIQGMGNFGGTKTVYFDIAQESITNEEDIEVTGRAIYIEGEPIKPTIIVRAKDGTTLVENQDYTVDEYAGPQEVNVPGTVKIHGMGNYKDERDVSFMIYPPNGDFVIEPIEPQEFRNAPIKPEVKVSLRVSEELSMELIEGQDYVLEWDKIQNAGVNTAKVTAKGLGYFGEKGMQATQTFTITPKSIGADGVIAEGITVSDLGVSQYTGSALTPKLTLTFTPPQPAAQEGEDDSNKPVELVQGRDYTIDYVNNVKVGVAKAVVKGIGNYAGSLEKEFEIHANMSMVTVAPIPMQNYTGSAVTPLPVVSLGGQTLTLDTDYRVSYSNNVDRGTATITITGIEPWYVGTRTVNFDIARELSAETSIRGVASVYTYTGSPIAPPVRIEDGGALLVSGVDYEVSYAQNVDAGTATVTIKGIGKYTGSTSTTFQIMPQQLGRAKVSSISDQIYNGKEQNPPVTVTSGDKTLENGKDYTLVYVNSSTPGMASVIVKGEGNYTGTQTVNYKINVPAMTGVKFSKYTNKSVTISWTKNSVVTGYEIYNAKNRRALRIKKATTTKGTVNKLAAGTAATFRVRAYVNKDGQYYYGPFTSIKTATAPNSTKISSLTSKKKKQVVVKWKKVKGATQYEVYRATSKKGKYKKIGTSKTTTYTDKKATGGKKYYYKIRVCKKINKKNYYSSYSAIKSVKAKK